MKVCPMCGRKFKKLLSLSRKDNETMICDNCGMVEAMADYYGVLPSNYRSFPLEEDKEYEYE